MILRVLEIRKQQGLSQVELAEMIGVSKGYLSELERGLKPANTRRLMQLATALGVDPADLLAEGSLPAELQEHLDTMSRLSDEDRDRVLDFARRLAQSE